MSYTDSLTEADEFLTYEEGRLQGLWDMYNTITESKIMSWRILKSMNTMLYDQQTLVDEMRGEEE